MGLGSRHRTWRDPDLHLILDNCAAHKIEAVKRWLVRRPRFHVHFTPTSASWLNAVEGLFAALTRRRVFRSVIDVNRATREYLDAHNADPKPFVWTASADTIIAKHQRGKRLLGLDAGPTAPTVLPDLVTGAPT